MAPDQQSQLDRIAYISELLERWEGKITRRPERWSIAEPAQQLAAAARLGDATALTPAVIAGIKPKVELVVSMLRMWSDKGDLLTWRLFRVQTLAFLAAATLMLIAITAYFMP